MIVKPPLTYTGGKSRMLPNIMPLIPPHESYIEPFCGGATVFFAKPLVKDNILNDTHTEVVNFYKVLQSKKLRLQFFAEMDCTPYARECFKQALKVFFNPKGKSLVLRAWGMFITCEQCFQRRIEPRATWAVSSIRNNAAAYRKKCILVKTDAFLKHISAARIECKDALSIIPQAKKNTFMYLDPPYPDTVQGHYKGYSWQDFEKLLKCLEKLSAKFMLSSFPSDMLTSYTSKNEWHTKSFIQQKTMASIFKVAGHTPKEEVLTMNYAEAPVLE